MIRIPSMHHHEWTVTLLYCPCSGCKEYDESREETTCDSLKSQLPNKCLHRRNPPSLQAEQLQLTYTQRGEERNRYSKNLAHCAYK